ncbi:hypothetical protein D6C86_00230 [Aureobasidium pullulans]|uniref:BTB domain-containing protein n=1 Tax=Aureobasidium pullulans TaxID=5580 RepID=A0A4S9V315_AURPU|nr:hypothetical protein D6C94_01467 [Aureobasidium pullulans]THZ45211.1 hypothetical protein D6C88_10132 [Aureobasidium pullulans]THZ45930.1 hypothetical protein D6C87_02545 [Aureobasidium pullulans]THZ67972.1 hypothetical protein D6C86_00230 [Aureobasidium pullulans]
MDDDNFTSGKHANSTVFNNSRDSDIIIKFAGHEIHAHRAILRLWSPFFERSLSSQFSVAKSPVFHLDDDDDADAVYAMLKHMYGMTFNQHPDNFGHRVSRLQFLWKAYVVADKYDCPSMRLAIVTRTERYLGNQISLDHHLVTARCTFYEDLIQAISKICGPDALQLACPGMRDAVFDWLCRNFDLCIQEEGFNMAVRDGTLLDAQLTTRLLLEIGKEVGGRGRRRDPLSRGSSIARWKSPLGEFFGLAG